MINTYYTHDNGGLPFKVVITTLNDDTKNKVINIYSLKLIQGNDESDIMIESDTEEFVTFYDGSTYNDIPFYTITNPNAIYVGDNIVNDKDVVSVLIKITDTNYVYVGERVYEFNTTEPILQFVPEVGNSDVIYSYAVGERYIYLFLEDVYYEKEYLSPYTLYYKHNVWANHIEIVKILHKRIY